MDLSVLENLSVEDLNKLADSAKKMAASKMEKTTEDVVREIRRKAEAAGITVKIYLKDKNGQNICPVKYRDPENPKNVYRGMGLWPKWLKEKVDAGAKLEDFLVI